MDPLLKKTTLNPSDSQLSAYLHQNILWPKQSGFRADHPTESHRETLHCYNSLPLFRCHSAGPFSGLRHSEPPDTSCHPPGNGNLRVSLFTLFLADHIYRVTLKSSGSDPCSLLTSVPKGSVLGSIVFSLYAKSLGHSLTLLFVYHSYANEPQILYFFYGLN